MKLRKGDPFIVILSAITSPTAWALDANVGLEINFDPTEPVIIESGSFESEVTNNTDTEVRRFYDAGVAQLAPPVPALNDKRITDLGLTPSDAAAFAVGVPDAYQFAPGTITKFDVQAMAKRLTYSLNLGEVAGAFANPPNGVRLFSVTVNYSLTLVPLLP